MSFKFEYQLFHEKMNQKIYQHIKIEKGFECFLINFMQTLHCRALFKFNNRKLNKVYHQVKESSRAVRWINKKHPR